MHVPFVFYKDSYNQVQCFWSAQRIGLSGRNRKEAHQVTAVELNLLIFRYAQRAQPKPFSSPETALLLISTKDRDLSAGSTLVRSNKSDWLRVQNKYSTHAQKIESGKEVAIPGADQTGRGLGGLGWMKLVVLRSKRHDFIALRRALAKVLLLCQTILTSGSPLLRFVGDRRQRLRCPKVYAHCDGTNLAARVRQDQ